MGRCSRGNPVHNVMGKSKESKGKGRSTLCFSNVFSYIDIDGDHILKRKEQGGEKGRKTWWKWQFPHEIHRAKSKEKAVNKGD
jgi:hypothetical protein